MGEISTRVKASVSKYCNNELDDSEFKSELQNIYQDHNQAQPIGLAIQKSLNESRCSKERKDTVWRLVDDIDPDIQGGLDDWGTSFGDE